MEIYNLYTEYTCNLGNVLIIWGGTTYVIMDKLRCIRNLKARISNNFHYVDTMGFDIVI